MLKHHSVDVLLLLALMLAAGVFSAFNEQEVWWDVYNYHYYNGWAFVSGKTFANFALAGVNTYLNPLPDVMIFWLIETFNQSPKAIFFINGLWAGALWFLVYKIATLLLPQNKSFLLVLSAVFYACCGYGLVRQIGTTTNEIPIAVLFLAVLYCFLKTVFIPAKMRVRAYVITGFLMGAIMGLKLTVAPFIIGFMVALFCFYKVKKIPLKCYVFLGIGIVFGFVVIDGVWAYQLWAEFRNPIFPYWNNLFSSPFAAEESYRDALFRPEGFLERLVLPFFCLSGLDSRMTDTLAYPLQIAAVLAVMIFAGVYFLKKEKLEKFSFAFIFLYVFWVVAYLLWLNVFAILRYAIVLETVGGILAITFVATILKGKRYLKVFAVLVMAVAVLLAATYPPLRQRNGGDEYLTTPRSLIFADDVTVILFERTTSFLVPFLNTKNKIVAVKTNDAHPFYPIKAAAIESILDYGKPAFDVTRKIAIVGAGVAQKETDIECMTLKWDWDRPLMVCPAPDENGVIKGFYPNQMEGIPFF